MKRFTYLVAILACLSFSVHADEYIGQVIFYSYNEKAPVSAEEKQDMIEVESDFNYHVEGLFKQLDRYRVKYEVQQQSKFTIRAINGSIISIDKQAIPISTGYIMIRRDGSYKINNGIGTDVDMLMDIIEYFGIKLEEKNT
jgi:hypothetical protein